MESSKCGARYGARYREVGRGDEDCVGVRGDFAIVVSARYAAREFRTHRRDRGVSRYKQWV